MFPPIDIPSTLLVFLVVNLCFTVSLIFLGANRIWDGAAYWITGNIVMLALILVLEFLNYNSHIQLSVAVGAVPSVLLLFSQIFKLLGLLQKDYRRLGVLVSSGLIVLAYLLIATFRSRTELNIGISLVMAMLAVIIGLQGLAIYRQRRWRILRGGTLFIALAAAFSIYLAAIAGLGLDLPRDRLIIRQLQPTQNFLLVSVIFFITTHICLVAMLMARLNRGLIATQLRQRRQFRLARIAEKHAEEMAAIAHEKQALLDVLIHEVRQPLNNAQAALQYVVMTAPDNSSEQSAGKRLQTIIDQVVLSLSNAIAGASVLERRAQSLFSEADVVAICQLACSDIGTDWESRVALICDQPALMVQCDPVLLRLAVRNLADNAVKHSALHKKVRVHLGLSENGSEYTITVTNFPREGFAPGPGLFERGVRGENASRNGKGLGLYIVRQIALLHKGQVEARLTDEGLTEFKLTFPK